MWNVLTLILVLQLCGQLTGHSIYHSAFKDMSRPHEQQVPVNQHAAYTKDFGGALHDLAAYQQRLKAQGLFPQYEGYTLTKGANGFGYQYVPTHQLKKDTKEPCGNAKGDYDKKPEFVSSDNSVDNEKHEVSGEVSIRAKNFTQASVVSRLNTNVLSASDSVDKKVNDIRKYVEKSVGHINKLGDDVNNKTLAILSVINKKLHTLEHQVQKLSADSIRGFNVIVESEEAKKEDQMRSLGWNDDDNDNDSWRSPIKPNIVHSEVGQKLKSLDVIETEIKDDLKSSISDAIKKAHDKFNQLIEHQVDKVNNKIALMSGKIEALVAKLTSIKHKKENEEITTTTAAPPTTTTPEYYKYTIPAHVYDSIRMSGHVLKRIDTDVLDEKPITTTTTDVPSGEDLQSQVLENLKDTLESVDDDKEENSIEEEKLRSDTEEQLRNEMPESVDVAEVAEEELLSEEEKINGNDKLENAADDDDDDGKIEGDNEGEWRKLSDETAEVIGEDGETRNHDEDVSDEIELEEEKEIEESTVNNVDEIEERLKGREHEKNVEKNVENINDELLDERETNKQHDENSDYQAAKEESSPELRTLLDEENLVSESELRQLDENDDDDDDEESNDNEGSVTEMEEENEKEEEEANSTLNSDEVADEYGENEENNEEKETRSFPLNELEEDNSLETSTQLPPFDELEAIQLIPIIIEQLRQGRIPQNEQISLEKIFGEALWLLIVSEASRNTQTTEMNPLLKTILNSEEVRLRKRDIQTQIGNDIYKNSLRRVYRGKYPSHGTKKHRKGAAVKPYIPLDDDRKLLPPSERLLNMIAAIVHKSNVMEKEAAVLEENAKLKKKLSRRASNSKKRNLKEKRNPLGIAMPRQRYVDRILSTNRMKRSIIKFGTDLADMKALLTQLNRENDLDENESKNENEKQQLPETGAEDDEDYYMDDDYDYSQQQQQRSPRQSNQLSFNDIDDDDDDDDDDDGDFYGAANHNGWRRSVYDDYENGSVNEFIHLARQRDRREKKFSPQLEDDGNFEFDDEEYDDN